jgi:hypothetical protein
VPFVNDHSNLGGLCAEVRASTAGLPGDPAARGRTRVGCLIMSSPTTRLSLRVEGDSQAGCRRPWSRGRSWAARRRAGSSPPPTFFSSPHGVVGETGGLARSAVRLPDATPFPGARWRHAEAVHHRRSPERHAVRNHRKCRWHFLAASLAAEASTGRRFDRRRPSSRATSTCGLQHRGSRHACGLRGTQKVEAHIRLPGAAR